jgi:hypothetical protein
VISVRPWPRDKPTTSKNGNKISPELEEHFKDHCYKCGIKGHGAKNCRRYPSKTVILTLCDKCRSGFHDKCEHPIFKNKPFVNAVAAKDGYRQYNYPPYPPFPYSPFQYPHPQFTFPPPSISMPAISQVTDPSSGDESE